MTNKPLFWLLFLSYLALATIISLLQWLPLWANLGVGLLGVIATTLFVSKRISNPLSELQQITQNLAKGEFKNQFPWSESSEISHLVTSLSDMATQLEDRFTTIVSERNEKETILGSLTDGVITLDTDSRIQTINHSAALLLDKPITQLHQQTIMEAIRNVDLQNFVHNLLKIQFSTPQSPDSLIIECGQRTLQVQGTSILDTKMQVSGALIVLHDLSPIKQFDAIRKDFVANVSHELKTPITLIKGAIETLEDPSLTPDENSHFLKMAKTHASRLDLILEDLLNLARLEQNKSEIQKETRTAGELLTKAVQLCQPLLDEKHIEITTTGDPEIPLHCNAPLLEQALINLIKNAIQYSESPKIALEVQAVNDRINLTIQDFGVGIAPEHLPRLFERFYRVDKARSRQSGGTGLGLALVKHIIQAHHGNIEVQSVKGEGTQFKINLPKGA